MWREDKLLVKLIVYFNVNFVLSHIESNSWYLQVLLHCDLLWKYVWYRIELCVLYVRKKHVIGS